MIQISSDISPSFWSRLFVAWARPLLVRGLKAPHTIDTILELPARDKAAVTSAEFTRLMESNKGKKRPVLRTLIASHWKSTAPCIGLVLIHMFFQGVSPMLLRTLINLLGSGAHPPLTWDPIASMLPHDRYIASIVIAFALLASTLAIIISIHHSFLGLVRITSRINSSLVACMYNKALRISREAKQDIPNGQVINLMAADVKKIHMLTLFIHSPFCHPFQITMVLSLLYWMLGWASLVGAGVMLTLLIFSISLARISASLRKKLLKISDRRISLINEVLTHMRVIKLYGWEKSFQSEVGSLRAQEVKFLSRIALVSVGISSLFQAAPVMVAASTFTAIALSGGTVPMSDLFASMGLYSVLRWSLTTLPEAIVMLYESNVSIKRVEEFFALPEHVPQLPEASLPTGSVEIKNCDLYWNESTPALTEINFSAKPGEFICVVGKIGSGKTALLLSVLGEMRRKQGSLATNGSLAYVSQHPWIVNDSLRNNITLGHNEDKKRYLQCLISAALKEDLKILAEGDLTEIGERGINLSGGQKQRVSLARAAYTNSDIYLLDDPVSALDQTVREKVFNNMLRGKLKGKTIILVTHLLEFADKADKIYVMENGKLVESGTPAELNRVGTKYRVLKASQQMAPDQETPLDNSALNEAIAEQIAAIDTTIEENTVPQEGAAQHNLMVDEERKTGSVSSSIYRRYISVFSPGILFLLMLLLFLSKDVIQITNDTWLARWSSGKIPDLKDFLMGYAALAGGLVVVSFGRALFVRLRGLKAGSTLHRELLTGVLKAPLTFFDSNPTGRVLSRFSGDIESVDSTIPSSLIEVLSAVCVTVASLFLIVTVNPILLIGIPPLLIAYYYFQNLFRPTSREVQRLYSICRSPIFAQYSETLVGLSSIRAFSWEEVFKPRMLRALDKAESCNFSLGAANRWLGLRIEMLGAGVVFAASISPVLMPTYLGSAGAGIAIMYAVSVTGALNWAIRMWTQLEGNMNSVERIDYYSKVPSEKWEGTSPGNDWPQKGALEFKDLSVTYREGGKPVLQNLNLKINAGERIGIAGRTGAGKSTVVLALSRLVEPSGGEILIDGISTATIPLEQLRAAIAVIPQDPVMFLGTLRGNLDPFKQFNDEEIWTALKRTHIEPFVRTLPQGLATEVHEGGINFSAGQRQLICLARALLRDNRIIVLDEATANVDAQTDALVQETVRKEFAGKTILTIAHRTATILDYDRVMVLDYGKLVEFDSVNALISRPNSFFKELLSH